ncbi:unnamed protein product [Caenorhabditis angaria]|uniref:CUB-like domain-containing protein n=1 Tax=Caenorhabditis angaria TaxID=860376 RepID=A0A9P1N4Z7_9PELO|nr:unnamed protein product [Caenorhabditis angaria]
MISFLPLVHQTMFHLYFALSILISAIAADPYICNGTNTISAPADLNSTINYPNSWNVSLPVPTYQINQQCRWNVEVPQGYFAYLSVSAETPTTSSLQLIYSNGMIDNVIGNVSGSPYMFLATKFSILLYSTSLVPGKLAFRINYMKMPDFNPDYHALTATDPEIISDLTACVITAPTSQVSLIASNTASFVFYPFNRLFVVFDGSSPNATYLGNLDQVLGSGKQLVSSGKTLTVLNLIPSVSNLGNFIMVQDYSNVKQFTNYRFATCIIYDCYVGFDAVNGTAAVVSISKSASYLKSVNIAPTSSLKVYYGSIKSSNIVNSYNSKSTGFPQKLNNFITTFVLDSNTGLIEISYENLMTTWNTVYNNRTGYVTSPNVGISSVNQSVTETFGGSDYYNYTTTVINHGLVGNATLQITTYDKSGNAVDDHVYNKNNLPPTNQDVHPGKSLSIVYKTNGENTTGTLIDFSIVKTSDNGTGILMLWVTFAISLFYL